MTAAYQQRTTAEWLLYWQKRYSNNNPGKQQASPAQSTRLRQIANSRGIDYIGEARAIFGCDPGALCVGASMSLANWFQDQSFRPAVKKDGER
jgi:hypothetical protein